MPIHLSLFFVFQLRMLKEGQEQLEKTAEEKGKRVEELLEALKEVRENELKLEESFRMELSAQQKLVTIYQSELLLSDKLS